jgi:hypothetical protein
MASLGRRNYKDNLRSKFSFFNFFPISLASNKASYWFSTYSEATQTGHRQIIFLGRGENYGTIKLRIKNEQKRKCTRINVSFGKQWYRERKRGKP